MEAKDPAPQKIQVSYLDWGLGFLKKSFYFDMILNLQKNCKTNTKNGHLLFTQNNY